MLLLQKMLTKRQVRVFYHPLIAHSSAAYDNSCIVLILYVVFIMDIKCWHSGP